MRVHADFLEAQRIWGATRSGCGRVATESIAAHELHLARNGYMIVVLAQRVNGSEQRRRFLSRLEEAKKLPRKFSEADVGEREHLNASHGGRTRTRSRDTSRPGRRGATPAGQQGTSCGLTVAQT